jgi:hypothetical protein
MVGNFAKWRVVISNFEKLTVVRFSRNDRFGTVFDKVIYLLPTTGCIPQYA